jgi:hypothetical protein
VLLNVRPLNIDVLNIFLIFLSGVLAYFFPLELFLLSYAILGPLHYLTEINWLNSKNYFNSSKSKWWLLVGLSCSLFLVAPRLYAAFFPDASEWLSDFFIALSFWTTGAIFLSFALAFIFSFTLSLIQRLGLIVLALAVAYFLNASEPYYMIFGLLVPTIIHVYLFTLLFMFYGARKGNSRPGYASVLLALLIPLVYVFIPIDTYAYLFPDVLKSAFTETKLHYIPVLFAKFLGLSEGKNFFFYEELELRLMMFISFIYLYHYLNWFSKTTVISWHKKLTKRTSLLIALTWAFLLFLFYHNFMLGFLASLFLSFLHVILEFPLNVQSIKSLFLKKV